MQLQQVFSQAEQIAVYKDGVKTVYDCGGEKFEEIIVQWQNMLENSVVMPAFGVSIDEHTTRAMQSGTWVEFCFKKQFTIGEMPFEKLLAEIKPEYMGFNVNRYNADCGYRGRCYYIDLRGGNVGNFYNFITNFN